jgi:hypothetical protein
MFGRVVDHVAALAERSEIARPIVGRVVVEVCAGDIDPRQPNRFGDIRARHADATPSAIAPLPAIGIPPAAIAEVENARTVRSLAMLAPALRAAEPDQF